MAGRTLGASTGLSSRAGNAGDGAATTFGDVAADSGIAAACWTTGAGFVSRTIGDVSCPSHSFPSGKPIAAKTTSTATVPPIVRALPASPDSDELTLALATTGFCAFGLAGAGSACGAGAGAGGSAVGVAAFTLMTGLA
jgi:hypothetical protein